MPHSALNLDKESDECVKWRQTWSSLIFLLFLYASSPPQQQRCGDLARRGVGGVGHRTGAAPARTEPTATVTEATTRSPTFPLVAAASRLLM